jgi:hypothetical protein
VPTGAKKENGPRLRLGQASNPSELGANEWRGQSKREPSVLCQC